jgi:hypothetical protein
MKLFSAAVLGVASAVDSQRPVISLDFDESMTLAKYPSPFSATPHAKESANYGVCPAGKDTNAQNCKTPTAKAFDHHDHGVATTETVILTNEDGAGMDKTVAKINFAVRSQYILKYNAVDASGNEADELFFTLILDDQTPPVLSTPSSQTVESCWDGKKMRQNWKMPSASYSAMDNIDGSVPVVATVTNPNNVLQESTTINTKNLGTYTVGFYTNDKAGVFGYKGHDNVASKKITVTVKDTIKPWVVVSGDKAVTAECTQKYKDAGAVCYDHRDSLKDGKLVGGALAVKTDLDAVEVSKVNKFTVSYSCTDFAGNEAKNAASREVSVVDTTNPVLVITHANVAHSTRGLYGDDIDFNSANIFKHINDDLVIHHSSGYDKDTQYLAKLATNGYGYKCTDSCAGTPTVTTQWYKKGANSNWAETKYDNTEPGTYRLDYKCSDSSGNSVSKSRTVINEDKSSIVLITQAFQYCGDVNQEQFLTALVTFFKSQGAAFFARDFIEIVEEGESRRLVEGDAAAVPKNAKGITLRFIVPLGRVEAGFASRILKIMRSDAFRNMLKVICNLCDSYPGTPFTTTSSTFLPVIYITGGDVTYVEANTVGTKFVDAGATCSDVQDGLIYENKAASATDPTNPKVDETELGTTLLNYLCVDKTQNEAMPTERVAIVRDTTKPVCKLNGSAKVTHEAGFAYNDHGCVCHDSYQGKLTPVITNNVNIDLQGTYVSACNAQDASGNKATTVSRTIVIADTLKPVIALSSGQQIITSSDASDTSTLADDTAVSNPAGEKFKKYDAMLWGDNENPV